MSSTSSDAGRSRQVDLFGAGLSVVCVAHCVSSAGLIGFLPLAGLAGGEWLHWTLAGVAACAAWIALVRPRVGAPMMLRGLAIAAILVLVAGAAERPTVETAPFATIVGGLSLALAHLLNVARVNRARSLQPA